MKRLTCGCCTDGCVCHGHCDIPQGLLPGKCQAHTDAAFEQLVLRVFKGLLIGAEVSTIRFQCESEGIDPQFLTHAIRKAQGTYNRLGCGRTGQDAYTPNPNPCVDRSCLNR